MMIPEPHDLGEHFALAARRLDSANFAESGERSFRFHDQADELHHAAARLRDASLAHAAHGSLQPAAGAWNGGGHAARDWRNCSILVSRRASISPNRV